MDPYEDNRLDLDDRNEYDALAPLVEVETNKQNNFDDIFKVIMCKKSPKTDGQLDATLTQQALPKFDAFGMDLARYFQLIYFK